MSNASIFRCCCEIFRASDGELFEDLRRQTLLRFLQYQGVSYRYRRADVSSSSCRSARVSKQTILIPVQNRSQQRETTAYHLHTCNYALLESQNNDTNTELIAKTCDDRIPHTNVLVIMAGRAYTIAESENKITETLEPSKWRLLLPKLGAQRTQTWPRGKALIFCI